MKAFRTPSNPRSRPASLRAVTAALALALALALSLGAVPARGAHVYLNELTMRPQGVNETVELHNSELSPVDVGGWKIRGDKGTYVIPSPQIIPGGGYVALNVGDIQPERGGVTALIETIRGGGWRSDVGRDSVYYGQSGSAPLPPEGMSLARAPDAALGTPPVPDPGTDGLVWTIALAPTFGYENLSPEPLLGGSLLINEFHPGVLGGGDPIEFYNPTPGDIDLWGWYLINGATIMFLAGVVPAGGFFVAVTDPGFDLEEVGLIYLFQADEVRVDQIGFHDAPELGPTECYGRCPDGAPPYLGYDYMSSGGGVSFHLLECSIGGSNAGACEAFPHWADHDVGNCTLTMTDLGILGFTDGAQSAGSGFVYPHDRQGENLLYLGGLWVGESPAYVANRDYDGDPQREWVVAREPDGRITTAYDGYWEQTISAIYTDSAGVAPRGLRVQQDSRAFASSANDVMDDFVIVGYAVENASEEPVADLYVGVFLDVDIHAYVRNTGSVDETHNLVYMADSTGLHVGLRLLENPDGTPPIANLTLIHNSTYVWPNEYILDADKYGFLSASGPEYVLTDAPAPDDYSILASAGPFHLAAGEETLVAFAVVGGESLEHLQQNAHVAQLTYENGREDVPADPTRAPELIRMLHSSPNPFETSAAIHLDLARAADVDLRIYDVAGRTVRILAQGPRAAGSHGLSWDGRDGGGRRVSSGVYLLRARVPGREESRWVVFVR